MTEKMRKLSLLLYYKEKDIALRKLQEIGAVHCEIDKAKVSEAMNNLLGDKAKYEEAIEIVKEYGGTESSESTVDFSREEVVAARNNILLYHHKDIATAEKEMEELLTAKKQMSVWGEFSWDKIKELKERSVEVGFFSGEEKDFNAYDFGAQIAEVINTNGSTLYFVVFSHDGFIDIPFDKATLSTQSLSEIESEIEFVNEKIEVFSERIVFSSRYIPAFKKIIESIDDELTFEGTRLSAEDHADGKVVIVKGFVPAKMEDRVSVYLDENSIAYHISEPTQEDKVPVMLKNGPYSKIFETITKIFSLPSYYEMDLTPFVAVFFPFFFAYCLGDTGYGLVIFLAAFVGIFTFLRSSKMIALLGIVFGVFTMAMGIVNSGVFFGMAFTDPEIYETYPLFLKNIAISLKPFVLIKDGQLFSPFNTALMVGVLQIHLGLVLGVLNALLYTEGAFNKLAIVLPRIGKMFFVHGLVMMFLITMQKMEELQGVPGYYMPMLITGAIMLFFLQDIRKGVNIRDGLLGVYFTATGLLGDTLSYVRLFALGISSFILGSVVNSIGSQFSAIPYVGIPIMILFFIAGHTLFLLLSALGSFVHPLRLTFVEFYNNVGFEGGGVAYKPLKGGDKN